MSNGAIGSETRFFSVDGLRQFFLNMKEFPEVLFYGAMARPSWYVWLGASPLLLILMPLIGLALAGMAALDIYVLMRSPNKNLDRWLGAIVASICTILASISISSLVLGILFGFTFAPGPWIFLSSVLLFGSSMVFNLGLTFWRILESPPQSPQRMHFIQRAINQLSMLLTAGTIVGCVISVILFPVSGPVATGFAIACVALTVVDIGWRYMPERFRELVKNWIGLNKPEHEAVERIDTHQSLRSLHQPLHESKTSGVTFQTANGSMARLFTAPDYLAQLKGIERPYQMDFLEQAVRQYSDRLAAGANDAKRVQSKRSCVQQMLENLHRIRKGEPLLPIHKDQYQELYQSFWRESEMEALEKAYDYLVNDFKVQSQLHHPRPGDLPALGA